MKKLKYVITTLADYKKASDILEETLIASGVNQEDIIYVYGKTDKFQIRKNLKNQICVFLKTNFFEFNGILGIFLLLNSSKDYLNYNYLLLHDTCKALKGFKEKSLILNNELNTSLSDIYWVQSQGRHNIGIFSTKAILICMKNCILPLFTKKFDKTYALKMEWDLVPESLHLQDKLKQIYTPDITLLPEYTRSTLFDPPRKIAYFTCINLIKYFIYLGPIQENTGNFHPNKV